MYLALFSSKQYLDVMNCTHNGESAKYGRVRQSYFFLNLLFRKQIKRQGGLTNETIRQALSEQMAKDRNEI